MPIESIAGPIAGAVVGGMINNGAGPSQTATKEPWAAAAPWLKDIVGTGQELQNAYLQNPFNTVQQTGMQNTLSDIDAFRSQMAPGLMDFANRLMGSNYQRSPAGTELMRGRGVASGGQQSQMMPTGLLGATSMGGQPGGPFSVPASRPFGLLNFQELNPMTAIGAQRDAEASRKPAMSDEDLKLLEELRAERARQAYDARFA
ncbi:MAG: hypothetical protein KGI52_02560 [Burkholderiales bacterium]|nr:hypothetical protein [Burkholderiales bacterium]